jgi:HSP20 family molecular chaperone IbpA
MPTFEPLQPGQEVFLKRPIQVYAKVIRPLQEDLGLPPEQMRYAIQILPLEQFYTADDLEPAQRPQLVSPPIVPSTSERVESAMLLNELPQNISASDPFFDLTQEINGLIAARAYEFHANRGFVHGHDAEDWLRAESEIFLYVPADITETESELIVYAAVPGFDEKDVEVRVAPHSVCITGERRVPPDQTEDEPNRIFLVLDLPSEIDTANVGATVDGSVLEIRLLKTGLRKVIPVRAKGASA